MKLAAQTQENSHEDDHISHVRFVTNWRDLSGPKMIEDLQRTRCE